MDYFFKISDLAKRIGKHVNTVDNWFKKLEENQLHYVNRVSNEKVYDELDFQIAVHIRDKREEKWALEAICNQLADHFELRPFPPEIEPTSGLQMNPIDGLRNKLREEVRAAIEEIATAQFAELCKQHEELLKQLTKPKDPLVERQKRVTDMITKRKVERQLEQEALHMWSTKPDQERLKRVRWFKKEEDCDKRDHYVKTYIDQNFEKRLMDEFALTSENPPCK